MGEVLVALKRELEKTGRSQVCRAAKWSHGFSTDSSQRISGISEPALAPRLPANAACNTAMSIPTLVVIACAARLT